MDQTYLQTSYVAPATHTVRYTYDPTGAASVSDFVITAGDTWDSVNALLADITAQWVSDLGAGHSIAIILDTTSADLGKATIVTPGLNFTFVPSYSGDGTSLATLLADGSVSDEATGYVFADVHAGGVYPTLPATRIDRTKTRRPRAQMLTMGGQTRTQHSTDPADTDEVELSVDLVFDSTLDYAEIASLEGFFDAVLGTYGEPFVLTHISGSATEAWTCRFIDPEIRIPINRLLVDYHQVTLRLLATSAVEAS